MSDTIPDPGDNGLGFGFGQKDVARISEAVRRVESAYRNAPPQRARGPVTPSIGLIPAVCTAGFPAGSMATPANATVTLVLASGVGFTTTGGTNVLAYNPYSKAIAGSSTRILWLTSKNGKLYVVTADCP